MRSRKAVSTAPASSAVSVFFAAMLSRAHSTATSTEPRPAISAASLARIAADASALSIGTDDRSWRGEPFPYGGLGAIAPACPFGFSGLLAPAPPRPHLR